MSATFNAVAEIIASNTDVAESDIKPESHLMRDLGIDSLAFLDLAFEIDQRFSIQMPVEDWMQSVNQGDVDSEEFFIVGNLCRQIDKIGFRARRSIEIYLPESVSNSGLELCDWSISRCWMQSSTLTAKRRRFTPRRTFRWKAPFSKGISQVIH